jgi:hypothetical protein
VTPPGRAIKLESCVITSLEAGSYSFLKREQLLAEDATHEAIKVLKFAERRFDYSEQVLAIRIEEALCPGRRKGLESKAEMVVIVKRIDHKSF